MSGHTPKKSHLINASDVLQGLLQNSKSALGDGFLRWRLEQEWPKVVGETIAKQTLPCAYERGTLHIWVRHPAWMQQLWFFKDVIRDKVNAHVQRTWADQIRFTLNLRAASGEPSAE
jgi:hypothetical protein